MKEATFFDNKVVIITGASSGIGKNLAIRFAQLNAKVALAARDDKKLLDIENLIKSSGHDALTIKADISVEKDVANLINTTFIKWGKIDIFISNAGQYIQGRIEDIDLVQFHNSFAVNFFGSLYAVKQILPIMSKQGSGHIVFINSLDSKKGIVGDAPYVAAKSALDGFGDVLRQELRDLRIKVSTVYPGRVDTPMIDNIKVPWISPKISTEKVVSAIINGIEKEKPIIIVPKISYLIGALNNLSPKLMDWFYKKFRLEGTRKS